MIGSTISHYKILSELGRGGMGVVYKAEDTKLERTVALKFLAAHLLEDEEGRARFIREAKAAAALDHQNICTVHEIDDVDGETFIAMAYIEGQTVKDKIAERPLKLEEALDIAIQTAQGLKAAHEKGIVHRDIKPANLMLTEEGQLKVMDFGLAQLAEQSRLTKTATILGTPVYMSPEQAQRQPTDRRTDIWSLGVVIYEMVTGRSPFEGERQQAVLYAIGNEEPEPITALRAGLPMELEWIVGKALAKEREERYQHVDEMLVDLRSLRQQIESRPRRPSATRPKLVPRGWPNRVAGLVTLLVVLIAGALYLSRHKQPEVQLGPAGTTETSVAVLPLGNLSGDPEQQYFSDGMTEALITELSKIEALRLISRTSVMRYKGTDKLLPEIARELNVGVIVEGSVLLVGNQVRITVQLIEAATDTHLWAESFDRDLGNVLALHSEVARAVAGEIRVKLTPREEARFGSARPVNTEAYDFYLRGKDLLNEFSEQAFKNSIQYFEQAIEIDPNYAPAHGGLAFSYRVLSSTYLHPQEVMPKAKDAALRALELDGTLSEAHTSLGFTRLFYDWDWPGAERAFKRALDLNPSSAEAHNWYRAYLTAMGRHEEAIAEARQALRLDPFSLVVQEQLLWSLFLARRYDEVIEQAGKALEMEPDFAFGYAHLGLAYAAKGEFTKAIAEGQAASRLDDSPLLPLFLAHSYAVSGQRHEAGKLLDEIKELPKRRYVCPYEIAAVYVGLGEDDQAFEWFQQAVRDRSDCVPWLSVDPRFDRIRSDPRFTELLEQVGLVPQVSPGRIREE